MKCVLVAGARPQFVKAAALLPALRARSETVFVHTGQHGDPAMVEAHFEGLGLDEPDIRLEPGRPRMDAMVDGLAGVIEAEAPDRVVVMGDADSTVAGARAAARRGVFLVHVEAGARSGERSLKEERNRIETDGLSDLLLCSTEGHARNLADRPRVHVVGDVMADVLLALEGEIRARSPGGDYGVLTLHRASTADDPAAVRRVMDALGARRVVFPVHPRTKIAAAPPNVELRAPMAYLDFLGLVAGASFVLTDSGGLQKEAYLLGVPCITLREATEWSETVDAGWNMLVGTDPDRIAAALRKPPRAPERRPFYGAGDAARRTAELVCTA